MIAFHTQYCDDDSRQMDAFRGAAEKGILQTKHFTAAAAADIAIAHRHGWPSHTSWLTGMSHTQEMEGN